MIESDKMLIKKIDDSEFKNFTSICDCIIKILDALKPLHEKGFLHLNISPDTLYFSDTGIVSLMDNTCAFRVGDDLQNKKPSFKAGYSASELFHSPYTKPLTLHYAADLYSVTAIFFRLLVGRAPKEGDWSNSSQWELNNKTECLKDASDLLVQMINEFLRKGLSLVAARRFEDVEEMREEIKKLKRRGA